MACLLVAALLLNQGGPPTVEIYRDKWGVPTLVCGSPSEAMFGLGYMHAMDNLERMALNYKIARGRSAEVLGRGQLLIDGFLRGMEIEERAQQASLPVESKRIIDSYVAGANRALTERRSLAETRALVPEWIEPFTSVDVLSMSQFMNCAFPLLDLSSALMPGVGSNQFAIAPKKSATGSPILSMDPHLDWNGGDGGIVWYEAAVFCPGFNFRGVSVPGSPGWIMGHNERFGWSVTNNNPQLFVRYQVERNPANAEQYSYHGEWRNFRNKEVVLRYRDGAELKEQKQNLRLTDWGPMVPLRNESVLLEPLGNFNAMEQIIAMMKSQNGREFRTALGRRGLSMWNFAYAGSDGTIGYQYNATLRKRDDSIDWLKPVPGNTPASRLGALWSLDELPHVENPASGVLVNTNVAPGLSSLGGELPMKWPAYVTSHQTNTRFLMLSDLLRKDDKIEPREAREYATDTTVPFAKALVGRIQADSAFVSTLKAWDGRADLDSRGAAAYAYMLGQDPLLGGMARKASLGEEWTAEERDAVAKAVVSAAEQMKADGIALDAPWGQVLRMRRGSRDIGVEGWGGIVRGSGAAVNPTSGGRLAKMTPKVVARAGSSYRMVVSFEPGGVRSWSILPYGNSHDPNSPYYANQMDLFSAGLYKDTLFRLDMAKRWAVQSIKIWR